MERAVRGRRSVSGRQRRRIRAWRWRAPATASRRLGRVRSESRVGAGCSGQSRLRWLFGRRQTEPERRFDRPILVAVPFWHRQSGPEFGPWWFAAIQRHMDLQRIGLFTRVTAFVTHVLSFVYNKTDRLHLQQ